MIIGHEKQIEYLNKMKEMGKLPHAFLFCGEEKLGKKAVALEFIKSFYGIDSSLKNNLDLIIVGEDKKEITIDQVRDIIWQLSLKPYNSSIKIAIINNAHLLNRDAQNALLKTLEEPKGNALIFLITSHPDAILETILSRVQKIKFFPLPIKKIEEELKRRGIAEKEVTELAELSLGKPGVAIELSQNGELLKEQQKIINDLVKLIQADLPDRFNYVKGITSDEKVNLNEALEIWMLYFRKLMIVEINKDKPDDKRLKKIKEAIKNIQKTNAMLLSSNVNTKLALEALMLQL